MQPTPAFLPGESPWTEEPSRLQSMGLQSDTIEPLSTHTPVFFFFLPMDQSQEASSLFLRLPPQTRQRA